MWRGKIVLIAISKSR